MTYARDLLNKSSVLFYLRLISFILLDDIVNLNFPMRFEGMHVRIRACMLTQTGFLCDFPAVRSEPALSIN